MSNNHEEFIFGAFLNSHKPCLEKKKTAWILPTIYTENNVKRKLKGNTLFLNKSFLKVIGNST